MNYNKFREDYLRPYIEIDEADNNFPHTSIGDIHFAAKWEGIEEQRINKLFRLINSVDPTTKKRLIRQFYQILDRKYNDQTISPDLPQPTKVGCSIDKVTSNGIQQIGQWATATNFRVYSWMIAGTSTKTATYGDTMDDIIELTRVNVLGTGGFLDPMNDGWNASGSFPRGTPTGTISEIAMANSETAETSLIFDRTLLQFSDRIDHVQNNDSFTLSTLYVITSI